MKKQKLKKELGLFDVYAIATGATLSSGFFLLPGLAAVGVGSGLPLAYLLAGLLIVPGLVSMAELATAMPRAGGVYYFLDRSMGPLMGTVGGVRHVDRVDPEVGVCADRNRSLPGAIPPRRTDEADCCCFRDRLRPPQHPGSEKIHIFSVRHGREPPDPSCVVHRFRTDEHRDGQFQRHVRRGLRVIGGDRGSGHRQLHGTYQGGQRRRGSPKPRAQHSTRDVPCLRGPPSWSTPSVQQSWWVSCRRMFLPRTAEI